MKKETIGIIVFLIILLIIGLVTYLLFPREQESSPELPPDINRVTVGEQLGISDGGSRIPSPEFVAPALEERGERDDRVVLNPGVQQEVPSGSQPRLIRLFRGPLAGYKVEDLVNSFSVRIVEQGIPNRYIVNTDPYTLEQFEYFGDIVRVLEAHLFNNGKVLMLYESGDAEHIIKSAFENFNIRGVGLETQQFENNIRVTTNNQNKLFFLREREDGVVGLVVNVENPVETKVVWQSDFLNWIPSWGRNEDITIQTPISPFSTTANYLVDPVGETADRAVGFGKYGSSVFVDGTSGYFVSYQAGREEEIGQTIITNQQRDIEIDVPIILPEKCDGFNAVFICAVPNVIPRRTLSGYETIFPDSWYQGDVVFNDSLLLVDVFTGDKRVLLSPNDPEIRRLAGGETFDIMNLHISESGEYVFFVNKKDLSLWMLRI